MPDIKLLPKNFFKKNPLNPTSAYNIACYVLDPDFEEDMFNRLLDREDETGDSSRLTQIDEEETQIWNLHDAEAIVKRMRQKIHPLNRTVLANQALSVWEETLPLILRRFRTSSQTEFIETAFHVFAEADDSVIEPLKELYPDIRDPYARSMACVVFGMHDREEMIPMLLKEYEQFQKDYPEEEYEQGPLLALYQLYGMLD